MTMFFSLSSFSFRFTSWQNAKLIFFSMEKFTKSQLSWEDGKMLILKWWLAYCLVDESKALILKAMGVWGIVSSSGSHRFLSNFSIQIEFIRDINHHENHKMLCWWVKLRTWFAEKNRKWLVDSSWETATNTFRSILNQLTKISPVTMFILCNFAFSEYLINPDGGGMHKITLNFDKNPRFGIVKCFYHWFGCTNEQKSTENFLKKISAAIT